MVTNIVTNKQSTNTEDWKQHLAIIRNLLCHSVVWWCVIRHSHCCDGRHDGRSNSCALAAATPLVVIITEIMNILQYVRSQYQISVVDATVAGTEYRVQSIAATIAAIVSAIGCTVYIRGFSVLTTGNWFRAARHGGNSWWDQRLRRCCSSTLLQTQQLVRQRNQHQRVTACIQRSHV